MSEESIIFETLTWLGHNGWPIKGQMAPKNRTL